MKKEKYLQIFSYLKEFSKLRGDPVRDIEIQESQYPEILWLSDIPENPIFENIIRNEFDNEKDYWLKIKKPNEPEKPEFAKLPNNLEEWVDSATLLNEEKTPVLKEYVERKEKTLYIIDFPSIKDDFNRYVNQKWIDDLIEYNERFEEYKKEYKLYQKLNDTYKKLFRINNKTHQFGEEYELVVGVGLLNYKQDSNHPKIFRHILTQRVDIKFEYSKKDSQIIVSPNIESIPQFETDSIIDLYEQFETQNIIDGEKEAESYLKETGAYTLFEEKIIENALQIFAERISPEGKYTSLIARPEYVSEKPEISFSPTLILRKRNTKSLTALYEKIIENIENSGDEIEISTINDLIGFPQAEIKDFYKKDENKVISKFETIFFPKEYNDEQIEIVEKTRSNNKVLVQGPPGTGKSHTIANLICHFLAHGKKVLITAYTKRALEVLKDKLPPEFKELTVNLLSGDSSSIQDLQSSVNSINDELSRSNLKELNEAISQLEKELKAIREKKAFNKNELLKIKEKTTRNIEINQNYSGTLMKIAEKLETDVADFEWYKDTFFEMNLDETIKDVELLIDLNEAFSGEDTSIYLCEIPELKYLPSIEQIKEYETVKKELKAYGPSENYTMIECDEYVKLTNLLNEIKELNDCADHLKISSKSKIIEFCLENGTGDWQNKIINASRIIENICFYDLKKFDMDVEIVYPDGKSLKQLKNDAKVLRDYIKDGKQLSGVFYSLKKPLLPKEIKEKLYFVESVFVNGSPCDTLKEFETVWTDICLKQYINELIEIFGELPRGYTSYSSKVAYFVNLKNEIFKLIEIVDKSNDLSKEIERISRLKVVPFNGPIFEIINCVEYCKLLKKEEKINKVVCDSELYLKHKINHPIKDSLLDALEKIDAIKYEIYLSEISQLLKKKKDYKGFIALKENTQKKLPNLTQSIISNVFLKQHIHELKRAILFRHAQFEIGKISDNDYHNKIEIDLDDLEKNEKKILAKLASKKAWAYVLSDLDENKNLRRNLSAFAQFATKAKGKGKRAAKFQKEVQKQMEKCKDSVPCWIMPLYKVAESIIPEQGMYDYVIIDEASQLGPDAIFLLYIAKNVIIVGDDKQIAPENIGVDAEKMTPHIEKYLSDMEFKKCFDPAFSFFDFAKVFCDGIIVLREHFRCMPEIIEFSNKYFYAPEGKELYPLKQYSEKRLEPLKTVFCSTGYIEGKSSRIINEPEAKAIADKIAELINDQRYSGKSIGIITLQGDQQARIIENYIIKLIGEKEYYQRKIVCGNSASFQGDERDVIFLSLVTANNHNRSALTGPADERRFNVAVSRAKEQVWLFHSVQLEDLSNSDDLRYKLLNHFKNFKFNQEIYNTRIERRLGKQPDPFESWFEVDVYNDIIRNNLPVIPQYEVAKGRYRIDLVTLFPDGTKIAIECDGDEWHGPEKYQKDVSRQKDLERSGWQFIRVRGCNYYTNREKALKPLWDMVSKIEKPVFLYKNNEDKGEKTLKLQSDSIKAPFIDSIRESTAESTKTPDESEKPDRINYIGREKKEESNATTESPEAIRYFNLYTGTGNYIISEKKPLDADIVLTIKSNQKNGFILQCYESGHVNKVTVSTLLSKKIGREYMNGMNKADKLVHIEIIESEKILGIEFVKNERKQFKAHLTEKIPSRELLYLQGYKVMYQEFKDIRYFSMPIEIQNEIGRLVFASFYSGGKLLDNKQYRDEWKVLSKFLNSKPEEIHNIIKEDKDVQNSNRTFKLGQEVTLNNIVKFNYNGKIFKIHIVDYPTEKIKVSNDVQKINENTPLARSIIGKTVGEKVKIEGTENYIEILDVYEMIEV